jgi:hypothetical protein
VKYLSSSKATVKSSPYTKLIAKSGTLYKLSSIGIFNDAILGALDFINCTRVVIKYETNIIISIIEPMILLFVDTLLVLGIGRNENKSIIWKLLMNFDYCISC